MWVLISTPLLQILLEEGFSANFRELLNNSKVVFVAYAFFNDTDLMETAKFHAGLIDNAISQMQ